jgi:hypothetical protein
MASCMKKCNFASLHRIRRVEWLLSVTHDSDSTICKCRESEKEYIYIRRERETEKERESSESEMGYAATYTHRVQIYMKNFDSSFTEKLFVKI